MKPFVFPLFLLLGLGSGCVHHHRTSPPPPPVAKHPVESGKPKREETSYLKPLLSPGALFGELPPAVQNTVRAEVGTAEVYDVVKDTSSGQTVYKIYFRTPELYPPMYIAPDGSVLHPDLSVAVHAPQTNRSGLKLEELPPDAMKVLHDRGPYAEIASINKEMWGDRAVYIVAFKDETEHPKLYVTADGTVFNETPK